jgi:hypothetical protein
LISSVQQAATVSYNNAASGLSATNVQNAIDEVEGRVDTAETNIANNDNDIATNAGNISANANNIVTNASNIINNASNIATNTSNIATNTSNIAANTSNIATNTSGISTNASNIATNTSGISTNASNIAANTASVVAIQKTYMNAGSQTFGRLAVNTYIQHSNWTGASVFYELETSQFLVGDKVYISREFTESGTTSINVKSGNLIYLPDKSSNQIQTLEAAGTIRLIKLNATAWGASA